jgi:hypothetical protein
LAKSLLSPFVKPTCFSLYVVVVISMDKFGVVDHIMVSIEEVRRGPTLSASDGLGSKGVGSDGVAPMEPCRVWEAKKALLCALALLCVKI